MIKKITVFAIILFTIPGFSQEDSEKKISNIQEYTPSKLLKNGQWDIKFFNSIYTQTKITDSESSSMSIPRENYFTNTTEIYRGVSKNSRINVGLIFQVRSNTLGGADPFEVFKFDNNGIDAKSGITTIAPSIRIQPINGVGNFSITSSLFVPIFKDRPNTIYLDERSLTWETRFFYDKTFWKDKWQLFTEIDFGFNFGENSSDADPLESNISERYANNSLFLPSSVFLSFFPSSKTTVFVSAKQSFLLDLGNDFAQNSTSIGFGGKYQITEVLNIEVSYDQFVRGHNFQGLGTSFGLGLRAIL